MDADILDAPSPNCGPRRGGVLPDLVVLHHTAMRSAEAARARLCDPLTEVSAHYLICERGRVWRLVPEPARAWHAGMGRWGAVADVNSRSIGIELANPGPLDGFPPFPEPQMAALERLLDGIRARWRIAPARVIAHSDAAPGRKADPGAKFDWRRLGIGGRAARVPRVWAETGAVAEWPAFQRAAERVGYRAPNGEWPAVLAAFRLRFRPEAEGGPLEPADVTVIRAVARAHPCVDAPPAAP